MMNSEKGGWNFNYSTRDIVIVAVIVAITGVVNSGVGKIWGFADSSLGPPGGGVLPRSFMWD